MTQPEPPPASLRLRVDEAALAANWKALDSLSSGASAGAAVKADCYGLGIDACIPVLREAGCEQVFVAHWSEAAPVARHVAPSQIAVLHGPISSAEAEYAKASGFTPVINSIDQARHWSAVGGGRCHLMLDTGINRLGVNTGDLQDRAIASLDIDVFLSHLARADEDSPMNGNQLAAFSAARGQVSHRRASLANSAGIGLGADYAFDLTRPGLALYGGVPRPELAEHIRQVAFVQAAIIQKREINAGDSVGYNAEFTAGRTMPVATVSLGYADGFLRSRGPGGFLMSGETALPILGKVSMDMVVVDLTGAPNLREGDWLDVPLSLPDAAQQTSLSQYEILTTIGNRLRV